MSFTVRQAQIIGLFVETLLYGMAVISFGVCLRCLFCDAQRSSATGGQVKRGLFIMSWALFIVASSDVALGVVNDYNGLVSPGGQDTLNTPNWLTVSRMLLLGIQNIIGDSIWIYRCWIIYERRWAIIALPSLLFFAVLGLAFTAAGLEPKTVPGPLPQAGMTTMLIAVDYGISFISSLLTTVLIVARLWKVDHEMSQTTDFTSLSGSHSHRQRPRSRLEKLMILVIESGLMFTTTEFFCVVTFAMKSNLCYVAVYMDIQVIVIAFNLIVIRLHTSRDDTVVTMSESWSAPAPAGSSTSQGPVL